MKRGTYEEAQTAARAQERVLVEIEREHARVVVRLNDPDRLNPLSGELTVQLHDALRELARDPGVRTVILTGVGLSFALACDLIAVSETARIVPAFGRIGLLPEVGQSWLLTRRLGYQRTFEMFATASAKGDLSPGRRGRQRVLERPREVVARAVHALALALRLQERADALLELIVLTAQRLEAGGARPKAVRPGPPGRLRA